VKVEESKDLKLKGGRSEKSKQIYSLKEERAMAQA
jgi:hypothetical protein